MLRTVLLMPYVSAFFLIVTGATGIINALSTIGADHALLSIVLMLVFVCTEALVLFYLIGTGRYIRDTVNERKLDREPAAEAASFKRRLFPRIMAHLLLFIAIFVSGGAISVFRLPPVIHIVMAVMLIFIYLKHLPERKAVIIRNAVLLREVDRNIAAAESVHAVNRE